MTTPQATARRHEQRLLVIIAAVLVAVVVAGVLVYRATRAPHQPATVGPSTVAGQSATDVIAGRPLLLGDAAAPVTLTLYEDFHCPHCADFTAEFGPTIATLQQAGTLKVDLMAMSFIDEGSTRAANAMACAAAAGSGQAYYDGLFADHEREWTADQLVALGTTVGIEDVTGFATCVRDDGQSTWVDSVNEAATAAHVDQTPTAFLNGAPVDIASLTTQTLTEMVQKAAAS